MHTNTLESMTQQEKCRPRKNIKRIKNQSVNRNQEKNGKKIRREQIEYLSNQKEQNRNKECKEIVKHVQ